PRSADAERQERLLLPGRVELATVASAFLSGALVGRHAPSAAGVVGSWGCGHAGRGCGVGGIGVVAEASLG
ncbi:MAG: hypothetical protein ACK6DK_00860, partial [Gemmatimonadota bacterium]